MKKIYSIFIFCFFVKFSFSQKEVSSKKIVPVQEDVVVKSETKNLSETEKTVPASKEIPKTGPEIIENKREIIKEETQPTTSSKRKPN